MLSAEKITEAGAEASAPEAPRPLRTVTPLPRDGAVGRSGQILGRAWAVIDVLLLVPAFLLAYQTRSILLGGFSDEAQWDEHWRVVSITALIWLGAGSYKGLYSGRWVPLRRELMNLAGAAAITALTLGFVAFMAKLPLLSRPLTLGFLFAAFAQSFAIRLAVRARSAAASVAKRRVIVVGSGAQIESLCRAVEERGFDLVGVITEDAASWAPLGRKRLGTLSTVEEILRHEVVDEVIFAVPKRNWSQVEQAFLIAEELGLETKLSLNFLPNRFSKLDYEELAGTPMLSFRSAPAHPIQLAMKRGFDVIVSFAALVLGAPVFFAIAVAVKLSSEGPVFFGQRRSGLNGREFTMWKFRSMVVDAEDQLSELQAQNEMTGPVFKMTHDPRVTRIGRFIRRTSLDELPQFWNVLIGQMSIVGPRPPIPCEVRKYARWQRRRLSVKPGVTCLWQISGRNHVDFETWMKLDLQYIDGWSFWLDVKIFLQTIPAVLTARGAR